MSYRRATQAELGEVVQSLLRPEMQAYIKGLKTGERERDDLRRRSAELRQEFDLLKSRQIAFELRVNAHLKRVDGAFVALGGKA